MMRSLLTLLLAIIPAAAQIPLVSLLNTSRPGSNFQIGDRFELVITAAPNQLVSVRTMRQQHTDWGPTIGTTDRTGRWVMSGHFEKKDFGSWGEIWTVGGRLVSPFIQFSVNAPCLPSGGNGSLFGTGPNMILNCVTAEGTETYATPNLSDSFRTPDGRFVNGRVGVQTQEQYYSELLQHFIVDGLGGTPVALQSPSGGLGDETADLIRKLIGDNALTEDEIRNTLTILRSAFDNRETIQPTAKEPSRTLLLLRQFADITGPGRLKRDIEETITYLQLK